MLKSPDWHLLIVWYFFLGGIAGGAYFTAAIADNFGGPRDKSVIRIGYVLALLLIGLCGILLILDLGTPSRFMNMMMHFKFWDPMSIGAWMLGVFGLFAFVSSALSLVGGEGVAPVRRVVSLVGTIAGFFIAAYTGVLLSATALPLWREARLMGALFLASGASTGMAAISLLLYLAGESAGEGFKKIKRADRYAIMFEILVLAAFVFLLGSAAGPRTGALWFSGPAWHDRDDADVLPAQGRPLPGSQGRGSPRAAADRVRQRRALPHPPVLALRSRAPRPGLPLDGEGDRGPRRGHRSFRLGGGRARRRDADAARDAPHRAHPHFGVRGRDHFPHRSAALPARALHPQGEARGARGPAARLAPRRPALPRLARHSRGGARRRRSGAARRRGRRPPQRRRQAQGPGPPPGPVHGRLHLALHRPRLLRDAAQGRADGRASHRLAHVAHRDGGGPRRAARHHGGGVCPRRRAEPVRGRSPRPLGARLSHA